MSKNMSFGDSEAKKNEKRQNQNTSSRIFGLSYQEMEKKNQPHKKEAGDAVNVEKVGSAANVEDSGDAGNVEKQEALNGEKTEEAHAPRTTVNQRSFMDENLSQRDRAQSLKVSLWNCLKLDSFMQFQQMQQKQWLDQQIADQKSLQLKTKNSDKLKDESNYKHESQTPSQFDRLAGEKQDMQKQIQEYNKAAAMQKRVDEKKWKEIDKMDVNKPRIKQSAEEDKKEAEDREEMVQAERALSRNIRQLSTQN